MSGSLSGGLEGEQGSWHTPLLSLSLTVLLSHHPQDQLVEIVNACIIENCFAHRHKTIVYVLTCARPRATTGRSTLPPRSSTPRTFSMKRCSR